MERYDSWIQVIDQEGKVVYSKYVPKEVPGQYSHFDLVNYVIESDRMQGYTLFINDVSSANGYSVIIVFGG